MQKYLITLLILFCLVLALQAQKPKSAAQAMLFSAIVPGSGQAYLGSYNKTGVFLSTELLLLGTTIRLNKEVDWAVDKYQQYAYNNTGIPLRSDKNIYQNMQSYISSEDYNRNMEHDAWSHYVLYYNDLDAYHEYVQANRIEGENAWDWGNEKTWRQYKNYRYDKQNLEMYSNLAVAAVVLNHVVGIIDAALTAKKLKRMTYNHSLYIDPDLNKNGMRLGYAFKF